MKKNFLIQECKQILQSFRHAYQGIVYVYTTQRNMKIHLMIAPIILLLAMILDIPSYQLLLVFFSIVFVICMELINTAIEKTIDMFTTDYHPLAKIAKDVAAGAVLLAAVFAIMVGLYVFFQPIWALLPISLHFRLDWIMAIGMLIFLVLLWTKKKRR